MSSQPASDPLASESLVIRPLRPADLPRVMEIEYASFSVPWTEATFRGLLRRSDADLIGGELGGRLIAYAAYWRVLDQAELGNIAVAQEHRRQGVGARMLQAVLERARERGVRELFLEVRVSNDGARHLYEKYGFREVGRRRNYYSAPVEDALVMCRLLDL